MFGKETAEKTLASIEAIENLISEMLESFHESKNEDDFTPLVTGIFEREFFNRFRYTCEEIVESAEVMETEAVLKVLKSKGFTAEKVVTSYNLHGVCTRVTHYALHATDEDTDEMLVSIEQTEQSGLTYKKYLNQFAESNKSELLSSVKAALNKEPIPNKDLFKVFPITRVKILTNDISHLQGMILLKEMREYKLEYSSQADIEALNSSEEQEKQELPTQVSN